MCMQSKMLRVVLSKKDAGKEGLQHDCLTATAKNSNDKTTVEFKKLWAQQKLGVLLKGQIMFGNGENYSLLKHHGITESLPFKNNKLSIMAACD